PESPGDVPVPHAVRRPVGAVAPRRGAVSGVGGVRAERDWVDGPVDGLDGLPLRDAVAAGPTVGGVALELGKLREDFPQQDRVGGAIGHAGDTDASAAAAEHASEEGGVLRIPPGVAGIVAGIGPWAQRRGNSRTALVLIRAVAILLEDRGVAVA